MDAPRKNAAYSHREKVLLSALVKTYNLVESKKTDACTIQEKKREWLKITTEYNAHPEVNLKRTTEQLKKLWNNLKQRTRKAHMVQKYPKLQTKREPYIEISLEDDELKSPSEKHLAVTSVQGVLENVQLETAKVVLEKERTLSQIATIQLKIEEENLERAKLLRQAAKRDMRLK